jgi:hypothetical protein
LPHDENLENEEMSLTFDEFCTEMIGVCINAGLFKAVMPQYPTEVQENFQERLTMMKAQATQWIVELQMFGEVFDQ